MKTERELRSIYRTLSNGDLMTTMIMVNILGTKLPVSPGTLYPPRSGVVLAYITAMNKGKGQAKKTLKTLGLKSKKSK